MAIRRGSSWHRYLPDQFDLQQAMSKAAEIGKFTDPQCRLRRSGRVPRSSLPTSLTATGDGERILPAAIVENLVACADGALEPFTEGSTRPVALNVTHAGI